LTSEYYTDGSHNSSRIFGSGHPLLALKAVWGSDKIQVDKIQVCR